MKTNEIAKKANKSKKFKILISETQFKILAQNVLNEQNVGAINKTYLVKHESNGKKK